DVIRGDYKEVHVKPAVKEELQRITALTLKHPKEFSYGVLERNKITGAILYGPPGTGKTILAKALSKHSGYNMMVLTSGDIYDPKWGEDEKFIRSTFRIAQRLHPCIVFIDEADAIFGKRTAMDRKHERGMLNQFLSEWDGIATGPRAPFILLATNRPNDIDEAVLRRAPVQILIDIPNRADRKSILEIYLKGEDLDPDIETEKLARMTQFYTGSDLKSLCVNAALACLSATIVPDADNNNPTETGNPQHGGSGGPPGDNPNGTPDSSTLDAGLPKRVLKKEHFLTAMKSIKPTGRGPTALAARRFKQKPM
ncbi:AAA-domain-containing protein, partial [Ascobolus immersus RN42]